MMLGHFSISLAVKNLPASRAFYEKLGFTALGGDGVRWQILQNGASTIGLFQGMFERNTLTFNPGWDSGANRLPAFEDIRQIQAELKRQGMDLVTAVDEGTTGPASLLVIDPDGNPVLIDQHVA